MGALLAPAVDSASPPQKDGDSAIVAPIRDADRSERISAALGTYYGQVRDDALAPLRWGGPGAILRMGFDHAGEISRHSGWF
jgi:hypothetical protein